MKQCYYCQKEIEDNETVCKNCGKPYTTKEKEIKKSFLNLIFVIGGLVGFILLIVLFASLPRSNKTINEDNTGKSWLACKGFISQVLKAPSSAKFESIDFDKITKLDENTFEMTITVDAQNVFGVYLRNDFYCKTHFEDETWSLLELTEN